MRTNKLNLFLCEKSQTIASLYPGANIIAGSSNNKNNIVKDILYGLAIYDIKYEQLMYNKPKYSESILDLYGITWSCYKDCGFYSTCKCGVVVDNDKCIYDKVEQYFNLLETRLTYKKNVLVNNQTDAYDNNTYFNNTDPFEVIILDLDFITVKDSLYETIANIIALAKDTNTIILFIGNATNYNDIKDFCITTIIFDDKHVHVNGKCVAKSNIFNTFKAFTIKKQENEEIKMKNEVKVLDIDGNELTATLRFGKVRHLLKDKKAKVVNNDPFTIQLLYSDNIANEEVPTVQSKKLPLFTTDNTYINYDIADNISYTTGSVGCIISQVEDNSKLLTRIYNNIIENNTKCMILTSMQNKVNYATDLNIISDIKEVAAILSDHQTEMMNRYKLIEQNHAHNYTQIDNLDPVVIIIDDLHFYMTDDDYKSVDIIKQSIGSIARLGRSAGIYILFTTNTLGGSTVSSDLSFNIANKCFIGPYDSNKDNNIFLAYNYDGFIKLNENQVFMKYDISDLSLDIFDLIYNN